MAGRRQAYQAHIEERGLERRVQFVGVWRDPAPLFAAADVPVHPSRVDTFGAANARYFFQQVELVEKLFVHEDIAVTRRQLEVFIVHIQ